MTITDIARTRVTGLARLRQLTGAATDEGAVVEAIRVMEALPVITPDKLVREGRLLVVPAVPGHVLTNEMVEEILAENY